MAELQVNGIYLNVEVQGSGPPLLLIHGFTGSVEAWDPLLPAFADFRVIRVDVIGHGRSDSPPDPARYTMAACAEDLAAVLDAVGAPRAAVLGYSMGGRVALRFALAHPERIGALVLESASPGIEDDGERAVRVKADKDLARMIEREGLPAFVRHWESLAMWASQAALPQGVRDGLRLRRLRNSVTGLANSLRGMGAGADAAAFDRLPTIAAPTLLIAGDLDTRYRDVTRRMAPLIAGSEAHIAANAGHAVHLEQPAWYGETVRRFLDQHRSSGT